MQRLGRRIAPLYTISRLAVARGALYTSPVRQPDEPSFSERIATLIATIPHGRVATYGQIAGMAGSPRAARQVVRILKMWSRKHHLPWHRVINREGRVSLPRGRGYEEQRALLEAEGVEFGLDGRMDLGVFQWDGTP